jgi:SAM-dependent methyltransferase
MTLLLGCGRTRSGPGIVTLDADARLEPDVVCTLGVDPLPFADDSVDGAIAIHVLEHIGRQGETTEWFQFWEELYRVLRPQGVLTFESPLYSSVWAWADPTHSRALSPQSFVYMSQNSYRLTPSAISPYRIRCDFEPLRPYERLRDGNPELVRSEEYSHFRGMLQAKKPFRPWWES